VAKLEIIRIEVVAPLVFVSQERLAGILGSCKAELELVSVSELITDVVTVAIAQVVVTVALTLVCGHLQRSQDGMTSVGCNGRERREQLFATKGIAHGDETPEELSCVVVEAGDKQQLVKRTNGFIVVKILTEVFYLLVREEGQPLQVLAGSLVDVEFVLCQVGQKLVGFLREVSIVKSSPGAEELLPGGLL